MSAMSIPRVKQLIRSANYADVKAMAEQALACATIAEVEAVLDTFVKQKAVC